MRRWTKACDFAFVQPDTETAPPPAGPIRAQATTRSKVIFPALLGLVLLAAIISAVLILPQVFGPAAWTEHSGTAAQGSGKPAPPPPEVKEPLAQLKPVQAGTIACYLADGKEKKRSLFSLKCAGGRADGRVHLVPTQPADLMRAGSTLVWWPIKGD